MADNDYNIIKPVESLQNIRGFTPVKRREERKRRQPGRSPARPGSSKSEPDSAEADLRRPADHKQELESTEGGLNESVDSETRTGKSNDDENDRHSIDYCA